jgi:excisionase family DNA binding protein
MADRVLIPLPGVGTLAMTAEEFQNALRAGAGFMATGAPSSSLATPEPLLDGDAAAAQLGVTARWLEDSARAGIIPHHKLGRFIRFRVSEVAAHCRVEGAPIPTDHQSFTPIRRLARQ